MRAVLCPVCNGKGTVYVDSGSTASGSVKTCHGCDGKGWVEVREDGISWDPSHPWHPAQPPDPYYKPWYNY